MALTRIDCYNWCPPERSELTSCLALNPMFMPGSLVFAGAVASTGSLSGQVACRLAIEHFVSAVLDFCEHQRKRAAAELRAEELSTEILEIAFKNANASVYGFGHRLAAGGRMASELFGLVIQDKVAAAGRVGPGCAYLFRAGELFSFFDRKESSRDELSREKLVGAHSLVSVELASVPVAESDLVVALSRQLTIEEELLLAVLLAELEGDEGLEVQAKLEVALKRLVKATPDQVFGCIAKLGLEAVYLNHAV